MAERADRRLGARLFGRLFTFVSVHTIMGIHGTMASVACIFMQPGPVENILICRCEDPSSVSALRDKRC